MIKFTQVEKESFLLENDIVQDYLFEKFLKSMKQSPNQKLARLAIQDHFYQYYDFALTLLVFIDTQLKAHKGSEFIMNLYEILYIFHNAPNYQNTLVVHEVQEKSLTKRK